MSKPIIVRTDFIVRKIAVHASDEAVIAAARVSTVGEESLMAVGHQIPDQPSGITGRDVEPFLDVERQWLEDSLYEGYCDAYDRYVERLERGFAPEVACIGLPVGLFSSMYVSCNSRSMMSFLQLRTKRGPALVEAVGEPGIWLEQADGAMFPSKPQHEINMVADEMERSFAGAMPITYAAWIDSKRVAP